MLSEEATRIKLERLEVLLDEKFKLIEKSLSDGTSVLNLVAIQTDTAIIHGKVLGIREVLEEK